MKKSLSCIAVGACALFGGALLTACSNDDKWIVPEFNIQNAGYTLEFTDNSFDFEFPITGLKFDSAEFNANQYQYAWIIKNSKSEVVGWIDGGSSYSGTNGKFKYGYSVNRQDGVPIISPPSMVIFLKGDASVFDGIEIDISVGSIKPDFEQPIKASEMYSHLGEPAIADGEKFVYMAYSSNFSGISPDSVDTVEYTLNIPNLKV